MPLTVDDRPIRPLTADEVMRMVDAGILGVDDRVELLEGVLTEKPVKSPEHSVVKTRLLRWLLLGVDAERFDVRSEDPLIVPEPTSLPEPDVAVVERTRVVAHPTTALLVVEVAVSSLATDTERKPALYAAAGVPEYWVVDVGAKLLRVYLDPSPIGYSKQRITEGPVQPSHVEAPPVDLSELFAGL